MFKNIKTLVKSMGVTNTSNTRGGNSSETSGSSSSSSKYSSSGNRSGRSSSSSGNRSLSDRNLSENTRTFTVEEDNKPNKRRREDEKIPKTLEVLPAINFAIFYFSHHLHILYFHNNY